MKFGCNECRCKGSVVISLFIESVLKGRGIKGEGDQGGGGSRGRGIKGVGDQGGGGSRGWGSRPAYQFKLMSVAC